MNEKKLEVRAWYEDQETGVSCDTGPNTELAVILLASGCTQTYIRQQCGFESQRQVQAFCRDDEVRREAAALTAERAKRVGTRALVSLEEILNTPQTDLRAQVLAIRTALEVSGDLKRDHAAPVKTVRELSVAELATLIEATKAELEAREGRYMASGVKHRAKSAA